MICVSCEVFGPKSEANTCRSSAQHANVVYCVAFALPFGDVGSPGASEAELRAWDLHQLECMRILGLREVGIVHYCCCRDFLILCTLRSICLVVFVVALAWRGPCCNDIETIGKTRGEWSRPSEAFILIFVRVSVLRNKCVVEEILRRPRSIRRKRSLCTHTFITRGCRFVIAWAGRVHGLN